MDLDRLPGKLVDRNGNEIVRVVADLTVKTAGKLASWSGTCSLADGMTGVDARNISSARLVLDDGRSGDIVVTDYGVSTLSFKVNGAID